MRMATAPREVAEEPVELSGRQLVRLPPRSFQGNDPNLLSPAQSGTNPGQAVTLNCCAHRSYSRSSTRSH